MKIEYIKELVKIVKESNINELEILYIWGSRLLIKKSNKKYNDSNFQQNIETKVELPEPKPEYKEIKSHEVGIFYNNPDEPLKEGDEIEKGRIIGFVKTRNIENKIESKYDGIVKKVCVKNEEAVEYNKTLFLVEPKTCQNNYKSLQSALI